MTFKDVAFRNFKRNVRSFFSYFICSTFAITIFFLYAALFFNQSIRGESTEDIIRIVFLMSLAALTLFSVFFIHYAHSSFIKARSKEFAILISLGMHKNELQTITLLENLIISLFSLGLGIVTGTIFSRLFQNTAIDLLDLEGVTYSLSAASFMVTAAVFICIFAMSQTLSSLKISRMELADLMKDSRMLDNSMNRNAAKLGIAGVLLVLVSTIFLVVVANQEKLNTNLFMILAYILMSFTGIYMVIAHLGNTLIGFLKNRRFYYHHILPITEIHHKFNQNKRLLFILTILSGMTLFLVASPFSLLQLSGSIAERNPYDIEFVSVGDTHAIGDKQLEEWLMGSTEPFKRMETTTFLSLEMNLEGSKYDILHKKPVISQQIYNMLTGGDVAAEPGEAVNIITAWEPGNHGIEPGTRLVLSDGSQDFSYTVKDSYHGSWFATASTYPSSSGIVVSDSDYEAMLSKAGSGAIGIHYGLDFTSWRGTEDIVEQLKNGLDAEDPEGSGALFPVASKLDAYKELRKNYSLFVFVTSLIGILFFAAGGMVLYFKQYTEMGNAAVFFRKLYKIGISEREVRAVMSAELLITFFVPLALGSILGYSFIYLVTHVMSGSDILPEFLKNTTLVVAVYFIFQLGFFYITRRKFSQEVVRKLGSGA